MLSYTLATLIPHFNKTPACKLAYNALTLNDHRPP
ncbi:hypothetical protein TSAR_003852 [Trichomalopsis sarcophagae]|uniref:Uncharacterized protein n=1 Tax=Trichomalopsis sarcophagae TaxID=543379 RepID=A0A232FNF7_9HYME|nr:hypothetical protein TSAR_003852 [Trichomalopsis sarcophagae]